MSDEKVIATADDAVLSKLWTSSMGYYSGLSLLSA